VVAAVGNAGDFKSAHELAAYIGPVPRHHASVGRTVMLDISQRGDCYLRTLVVHGARAAMHNLERRRDPRSAWAARLKLRRGTNIATVALANKNALVMVGVVDQRGKGLPRAPCRTAPDGAERIGIRNLA
jgi:transposase